MNDDKSADLPEGEGERTGSESRRHLNWNELARRDKTDWSKNAYACLWNGLANSVQQAESLRISCEVVREQMKILDGAPGHDVVLDQATWDAAMPPPLRILVQWPISRGKRELIRTVPAIESAVESVRGLLGDDEKTEVGDRLDRHLEEARKLVELFAELETAELPVQPYLLRQQSLTVLVRGLNDLVDDLVKLRKGLDSEELGQFFPQLTHHMLDLIQLRDSISELRDSPRQMMFLKFEMFVGVMTGISTGLTSLRAAARAEVTRQGMIIWNRAGPANMTPAEAQAIILEREQSAGRS